MKLRIFSKYLFDFEPLRFITEFAQLCEEKKSDLIIINKTKYN